MVIDSSNKMKIGEFKKFLADRELITDKEKSILDVMYDMTEAYDAAISKNPSNKPEAKESFLSTFNPEHKKIAEKAFDAMYSFYNGKATIDESNKSKKITDNVTVLESVKALILAIVTLGLARSTRACKNDFQSFVKAQSEAIAAELSQE